MFSFQEVEKLSSRLNQLEERAEELDRSILTSDWSNDRLKLFEWLILSIFNFGQEAEPEDLQHRAHQRQEPEEEYRAGGGGHQAGDGAHQARGHGEANNIKLTDKSVKFLSTVQTFILYLFKLAFWLDVFVELVIRSRIWPPISMGNALDSVEDVSWFIKLDDVIASRHAVYTHCNIVLGRVQL